MFTNTSVPEQLPILSRGKHRNPRKGACFMELASFLSGERWSDHPSCTHPLLAALARCVNDYTSDAARPRLAELIPSVIGLTSDDLHVDVRLALLSARTALPVVAAERQRALAVGILACERVLAGLDDRPIGSLEASSRRALEQVPEATRWARRFTRGTAASPATFQRNAAPSIVVGAVEGIARACIPDPDRMLRGLLLDAIRECEAWTTPAVVSGLDTAAWVNACELTGALGGR